MEKKSRIVYLLKYLMENSDEDNPVSTSEIIEYMESQGISIYRTTLSGDIAMLIEAGFDIITVRSSQNKYFIGNRTFQTAELQMLVDAVASSKFITAKKSRELIDKIGILASKGANLDREIFLDTRAKPINEQVYYNVDKISESIRKNIKLEFLYLEYDMKKNLTHKHDGHIYKFSPYTTFWSDDHYYAIGYSDKHGKIATFRIDRMDRLETTVDLAEKCPDSFDPGRYITSIFEMFDGESRRVELRCKGSMMNVIVDRFGEDVLTEVIDENHFKATVDVVLSPRFYGWLFGFGGMISLLSPEDVINQYRQKLKEL